MRLIHAVIILKHDCERFSGLHIGDAGAVNAIRSNGKLFSADIARDNAPHQVFGSVDLKLSELYRYRAKRRDFLLVSLVAQAGSLS